MTLLSTGDGCWRRRVLLLGAIANMGARPSASAALATAFQLPRAQNSWKQRVVLPAQYRYSNCNCRSMRERPFIEPIEGGVQATHMSSSSLRQAAKSTLTGWINPDKLDLRGPTTQDTAGKASARGISDDDSEVKIISPAPSTVERLLVRDRMVLVKRDDALHLPSSNVSGNKARKFQSLNDIPAIEFPDAIVSYGGPQSNAMVALAAIVSSKNAELGGVSMEEYEAADRNEGARDMFWQLDVSDENGGDVSNETTSDGEDALIELEDASSVIGATQQMPKKRFIYYTKSLPRYLRKNPNGNMLRALALGMEIRTVPHEEYKRLFGGLHGGSVMAPADLDPPVPGRSLWLPQGGACSVARPGSDALAREIVDYWSSNGRGMPLAVCVPGGTCTTALLLHRSINELLERRELSKGCIRVVVIPCVGDDEYAMRQMISLDKSVGGRGRPEDMPQILKPRSDVEYGSARRRSKGYFTFGEPAKSILQTYDEMNENGLFLDLLYGAPAWSLLLQHWKSRDNDCPISSRQVMYVHSGGLEGIASQLTRYKHKGLIDARTIQLS